MPRNRRKDWKDLLEVFSKYKTQIEKATCGDEIWKQIAKDLGGKVTPKYCYLIITQNRNDICTQIGIKVGYPEENSSLGSGSPKDTSDDDYRNNSQKRIFNITFTQSEFSTLIQRVHYHRQDSKDNDLRGYNILTPYSWTNTVHEKFFVVTRLPCSISYKRNKILPDGSVYLTMCGTCTSCQSKFIGKVLFEPEYESNKPVIMECEYIGNFNQCAGERKRRLIGIRKQKMLKKLVKENKSASYIRRSTAAKIMAYGEQEPSHIPSASALRTAKSKAKKKKLLDDNPIISVTFLKSQTPYSTIIRDIGIDPFFVHYWSSLEINNYRTYCKRNSVPKISVDATGSCVRNFELISQRKTNHIFLYEIVVYDEVNQSQFSVAHMLSERHNNNAIGYWLGEWLREKITPPKVVVMDQSLALMLAAVRAFTQYSSLSMYISVCYKLLIGEKIDVPSCAVRNDVCHIMHLISSWPAMKKVSHPRFKKLYMHAMGLVVTSTDYEDVKQILRHIFTVALYVNEGYTTSGEPNPCERAKLFLQTRIAGHSDETENWETYENSKNINDPDDPDEINDEEMDNEDVSQEVTGSFLQDAVSIFEQVEKQAADVSNDGNRGNVNYSPELASKLVKFCKLIPCWSGIMVPIFKYGSATEASATVESVFNDIKNRIFKHRNLPIRMDEFMKNHIDSNLGSSRLLKSTCGYRDEQETCDDNPNSSLSSKSCSDSPINDEKLGDNNVDSNHLHRSVEEKYDKKHFPGMSPLSESQSSPSSSSNKDVHSLHDYSEDLSQETNPKIQSSNPTEVSVSNTSKPSTAAIGENTTGHITHVDAPLDTAHSGSENSNSSEDEKNYQENWRGLAKSSSRKRRMYLQKNALFSTLNLVSRAKSATVGVIKNGNISDLQGVCINRKYYSMINTCAFDTLVQVLSNAYACSEEYQDFTNAAKNTYKLFEIIANLVRDQVTVQTYRKRALLLNQIFKSRPGKMKNHFITDTRTTVTYLASTLLRKWPSAEEIRSCNSCSRKVRRPRTIMTLNIDLHQIDFASAITETLYSSAKVCESDKCGSTDVVVDVVPGKHLLFETATTKKPYDLICKFENIPKDILITGKKYFLRGIIEFRAPNSDDVSAMGHYVAHCWDTNRMIFETIDDLLKDTKLQKERNSTGRCQLILYSV